MPDINIDFRNDGYSGACTLNGNDAPVYNKIQELNNAIYEYVDEESIRQNYSTSNCSDALYIKLWMHLLKTETAFPHNTLAFRTQTANPDADDVATEKNSTTLFCQNYFNNISNPSYNGRFTINILHIRSHAKEYFEALDAKTDLKDFRLIPEINIHLTLHNRHKIKVYEMPDNKGIMIVTSSLDNPLYSRILGSIWGYLKAFNIAETLKDVPIEKSFFKQFCKVLYKCEIDEYVSFMNALIATQPVDTTLTPETINTLIKSTQEEADKQTMNNITNNITSHERNIRDLESALAERYKCLRDQQLERTKFELGQRETNENLQALLDFVNKIGNTVKIIERDNEHTANIVMDITVPINSFRKKDAEMYFKSGLTVRNNLIQRYPEIACAFKKCFIDEEYELWATSRVSFCLVGNNCYGISDNVKHPGQTGRNKHYRLGNPHIESYDCFSSSKAEITKATTNGQYIAALSAMINACTQITFTDSTVIGYFTDRLHTSEQDRKILKRKSDGAMLSIKELYAIETAPKAAEEPANPTTVTVEVTA